MDSSIIHTAENEQESAEQPSIPIFAYELLRDVLLPDLLGEDTSDISYWAGKQIARKFPLLTYEEAAAFFEEAGWGQLCVVQSKKKELHLELSGTTVERRLRMQDAPCFRLEAGFLAEQLLSIKQAIAEAFEEIDKKNSKVSIIVRWDARDKLDHQ